MVAGGNLQRDRSDFDRVYDPVGDFTNTMLSLLFCLLDGSEVLRIDARAAFLNRNIDRDVFAYHPNNLPADELNATVCKKPRALYGL